MTNKYKSLASESVGDVFVRTIPSLGHSWGGSGESSIGSKTKLFEKVFFARVKKSRFSIFLKSIVPARKYFAKWKRRDDFFENGGLLANSSVSKFVFGF